MLSRSNANTGAFCSCVHLLVCLFVLPQQNTDGHATSLNKQGICVQHCRADVPRAEPAECGHICKCLILLSSGEVPEPLPRHTVPGSHFSLVVHCNSLPNTTAQLFRLPGKQLHFSLEADAGGDTSITICVHRAPHSPCA